MKPKDPLTTTIEGNKRKSLEMEATHIKHPLKFSKNINHGARKYPSEKKGTAQLLT